jgi:hypothetical protein
MGLHFPVWAHCVVLRARVSDAPLRTGVFPDAADDVDELHTTHRSHRRFEGDRVVAVEVHGAAEDVRNGHDGRVRARVGEHEHVAW